jgi:hypothetical protein
VNMQPQVKEHRIRLPSTTLSISVEPAYPGGYACVVIRYTEAATEPAPATAPEPEPQGRPHLRVIAGGRSG